MIAYRLSWVESDGTEATARTTLESPNLSHVADVVCLARGGVVRWACEESTGRFLAGFDANGRAITNAPRTSQPAYLGDGRAVYHPAVRIYNPGPDLAMRAVRGMSAIVLAYQGDECRGWVEVGDLGFQSAREAAVAGRVTL